MESGKLPGRGRLVKWSLALLLLVGTPAGMITAQQLADRNLSPAVGSAQVVAQGLLDFPDGPLIWRFVERQALPRGEAQPGTRVSGWVFAREESILIINVDDDTLTDVARLAPGEAYFVPAGTNQIRASESDQATTYVSFELVPAELAQSTGSGRLLYTTDAFTAPEGLRDTDLVANVLPFGATSEIPHLGGQIAILAAEGVIEVTAADGAVTVLSAGETAVFDSAVTITGGGSASTGGVNALAPLYQASDGAAVYFAAVIGQEVIPSSEFTRATEEPTIAPEEPTATTPPPPVEEPTPTSPPAEEPPLESDFDQDGLTARDERVYGTDPNNWDTDGDGLGDGHEIQLGTDPLKPDTDGDGFTDYEEVVAETDPLSPRSHP